MKATLLLAASAGVLGQFGARPTFGSAPSSGTRPSFDPSSRPAFVRPAFDPSTRPSFDPNAGPTMGTRPTFGAPSSGFGAPSSGFGQRPARPENTGTVLETAIANCPDEARACGVVAGQELDETQAMTKMQCMTATACVRAGSRDSRTTSDIIVTAIAACPAESAGCGLVAQEGEVDMKEMMPIAQCVAATECGKKQIGLQQGSAVPAAPAASASEQARAARLALDESEARESEARPAFGAGESRAAFGAGESRPAFGAAFGEPAEPTLLGANCATWAPYTCNGKLTFYSQDTACAKICEAAAAEGSSVMSRAGQYQTLAGANCATWAPYTCNGQLTFYSQDTNCVKICEAAAAEEPEVAVEEPKPEPQAGKAGKGSGKAGKAGKKTLAELMGANCATWAPYTCNGQLTFYSQDTNCVKICEAAAAEPEVAVEEPKPEPQAGKAGKGGGKAGKAGKKAGGTKKNRGQSWREKKEWEKKWAKKGGKKGGKKAGKA